MFIQMTPVQQQAVPRVAAVFQAANCTLDKALIYDVSLIDTDSKNANQNNANHERRRSSNGRHRAHVIKKGNYYTGSVNPTERTIPVGLTKTASHR